MILLVVSMPLYLISVSDARRVARERPVKAVSNTDIVCEMDDGSEYEGADDEYFF